MEIRSAPLPPLADGQVLVRTVFSGVSAGTELLAYRGQLDPEMAVDETIGALGGTFRYPFQYGYSCVGHVEESRSDVAVGDLVFAFHPHQDRFVADAGDVVVAAADRARVATLLPFVETALQLDPRCRAGARGDRRRERRSVSSACSTSCCCTGPVRDVIAVEPRRWRRELARGLGATAVAPEDVDAALDAAGRPDGVALVVEVSGNPEALPDALRLLAHEGTALVGSWYGRRDVVLPLGDRFHRRRLTIRSSQVSTIPAGLSARWDRTGGAGAPSSELMATLPLDVLATHTVHFDDAAARPSPRSTPVEEGLLHVALGYS